MMKFRRGFFWPVLLFLLFPGPAFAQNVYIPGRDWARIRGSSAEIIFPRELENEARKAAELLDRVLPDLAEDLGVKNPRRWTLVLNYDNLDFNGYVTAVPRYSLWYQGSGESRILRGDWMELLALHEGRHMAQFDRLCQGMGRLLYFLFGGMGTSYLSSLVIRPWLMEGDAVLTETLGSPFGRGRDPEFYRHMKALALGNVVPESGELYRRRDRKYHHVLNGSYREILPNWYEYGYFLAAHIQKHYGPDALDRIYDKAMKWPLPVLGLYLASKEVTGKGLPELFQEVLAEIRVFYSEGELPALAASDGEPAREYLDFPRGRQVFSYSSPGDPGEGKVGILKASWDDRNRLLIFDPSGGETIERPLNAFVSSAFALAPGAAVYVSRESHPRWGALEYGDLILLDLASGKKTPLSRGERYTSAAVSPDSRLLAAVGMDSLGRRRIDIFSLGERKIVKTLEVPPECLPGGLAWHGNGRDLAMTLVTPRGRGLSILDTETRRWEILVPPGEETIRDPVFWDDWVLFSSGYTGTDGIHAVHRTTGELRLVHGSPLGVSRPWAGGGYLYFVEFLGTSGEAVGRIPLDPETWIPREVLAVRRLDYFRGAETGRSLPADFGAGERPVPAMPAVPPEPATYPAEKWRPIQGWFNVHSWGLDFSGLLEQAPELRLGIQSQDILETFGFGLYGLWNIQERTFGAEAAVAIRRFFPVFSFAASFRERNLSGIAWNELGLAGSVSLPLDFTRNYHVRKLELSAGIRHFLLFYGEGKDGRTFLSGDIFYGNYLGGGVRRIRPLWGFTFQGTGSLGLEDPGDWLLSGQIQVFFPGLFKNHSLTLEAGGEILRGTRSSALRFSRGYQAEAGGEKLLAGADYDFPLLYADAPLWSLAYIKRLRAKICGDFFLLDGRGFHSAGIGLIADYHLLGISQGEFSTGALLSYRFLDGGLAVQVLLNLAL